MSEALPAPRVLVLTGGLIHLVHQLAVLDRLPELLATPEARAADPPVIGILLTGVLRRDPEALARQEQAIERWLACLRLREPGSFAAIRLLGDERQIRPGDWDLISLNNQWQASQRELLESLNLRDLVVCGDGLGLYYRCARELRAIVPSLLNRPIPEPGRRVRYGLSGRQPIWHRPPVASLPVPQRRRLELFELLVDSQQQAAAAAVSQCLAACPSGRPLWLCSVPNLAHQFPGGRIAASVLDAWRRQLERRHGFDAQQDRLVLIDHPKAPPDGSFGPREAAWLAGPLRPAVPLEVLVELLWRRRPQQRLVVVGLTSALYGARRLTGAEVIWLGMGPLWWGNPLYRRRPIEFLHRSLRTARMALITRDQ